MLPRYLSLVALALVACRTPETAMFDAERPWRRPGDVIDSILPMEEHERRFREGVPEVTALRGGAADREELAERFLAAVAARDSVRLGGLLVDRAEFAWLVFPDHLYRRPPYELDPGTLWMQLQGSSAKGMARLLERHGGRALAFRGLQCERDTLQLVESRMALWGPCEVEYSVGDSVVARRLFGSIVERDGVVKFLSYANDF